MHQAFGLLLARQFLITRCAGQDSICRDNYIILRIFHHACSGWPECVWGGEACWWQTGCAGPIAIASLVSCRTIGRCLSSSSSLQEPSSRPSSSSSIMSTASLWPHTDCAPVTSWILSHGWIYDALLFRIKVPIIDYIRWEIRAIPKLSSSSATLNYTFLSMRPSSYLVFHENVEIS